MTDGDAYYPDKPIAKIKKLMTAFPNKFKYSGIEFECKTDVMKKISRALEGLNIRASNP